MRGDAAREHADCVTRHGVTGPPAPERQPGLGGPPGAATGDGRAPHELDLVLSQAAVAAIEAVGGYAGGVYLRTPTEGLLRLAVLAGLPGRLFRPWWRMHVNRPFPVAEAYRLGRAVHLADAEDSIRRFPQLMAGLPFPFGSLYVPVAGGGERFGVLAVLRRATPGRPVDDGDRHRIHSVARRLGIALGALSRRGIRVEWGGEPLAVQLPAALTPPVRTGRFTWNLGSGTVAVDAGMRAILGVGAGEFPGTIDALTEGLAREDVLGLWALARRTADSGRGISRRIRLPGPDGRPYLVELSGNEEPGGRLEGFVLDLGVAPIIAELTDRVPRGVLSLDRLGRIVHLNQGAETLLGRGRPELAGRVLWDVFPWLGRPVYEEHFRAALISHAAVTFVARRGPDDFLSFTLYPGHDGVTVSLLRSDEPAQEPPGLPGEMSATGAPPPGGPAGTPIGGTGAPDGQAAAFYRPVALAIALTEAVTARQVSRVVTEELLPAFGGGQLAIYLLHERHLFLASETGFPQGFLDRFDGVALDARLPGVETLTLGRPLFFESMDRLAAAYPGIPLDAAVGARAFLPLLASGRPVGSCILGFDQPRSFSPEERTVLTALAGLIAQALERAQRYDSEAALARGLQDALLPHRLPVLTKAATVGRYLPGTQGMEVGGDWYDVVETGDSIALVIGDVQGHGVSAAATMGQLRSAVRAFALSGHDPQEVMSGTNRLLIDLDPGQFASCCYVVVDPATGLTQAVRAGHPQPLLHAPGGGARVLDLEGGIVLGVDAGADYPVTELRLESGAVLALYTDGLVERPGIDIDHGVERVRATLAACGASPLAETADRLIREARAAADRADDIALLLASRWD
ncbi:SpoIIE family protein phosphatase [Streptomyces clavuligerus]|uniref:protein-serine/threonine phosphatase n=3 Tax=Streptomyces clavuligerus TaxID=1901 RepID=E2Q787_STRCL|nr:SpoIIE family protein phosphatase [Streptomyces clavuligerus]ANW21504.1 diguanylate cyclase [Streptomyces clavuligerus]AXU16138.1 diguanylate cyclase [Streptomyces clavuligerus]EFG05334.1 magnesium or manganese-dependent protein phosphatase [Streptomyces clavuligerus]MBY6306280.1 SpoIIE family protein phosphatase [Streptomyces clavuligerus]QCS08917.1 diguanylate cyclase [Streptomyces clavuligerus]